jgi:hypothetical protein
MDKLDTVCGHDELYVSSDPIYSTLSMIKYEDIDKYIENYDTFNRDALYTYEIRPYDNNCCACIIKVYGFPFK